VVVAGYFLGSALTDLREQNRPVNDKNYEAAPVSIGPLTKTLYVDTVELSGGQSGAILPNTLIGEIELKQTVLLFNKDGKVLPTPARVQKIEPSADSPDFTKIIFDMPDIMESENLANKAGILVKNILITKRLPHSAMVIDTEGNTYLWTVKESLSKENSEMATSGPAFIAQRVNFTPAGIGDDYFAVGREVRSGTPVILNPDSSLHEGPLNNIDITELDAPLKDPLNSARLRDERESYIIALEEARRYYEEFKKFQPVACPGMEPVAGGGASSSCGSCGAPAPTLPEPTSGACPAGGACNTAASNANTGTAAAGSGSSCGSCGAAAQPAALPAAAPEESNTDTAPAPPPASPAPATDQQPKTGCSLCGSGQK